MSTYFISDLHLGHKNILKFSPNRVGNTVEHHDGYQIAQLCSVITKRDLLFILGDVAFDIEALDLLKHVAGRKILVRGNHDAFQLGVYNKYFEDVRGFFKYKEFWISHAPIHPEELRGRRNIHGHVHMNTINDNRYINVCADVLKDQVPVSLEEIRNEVANRS